MSSRQQLHLFKLAIVLVVVILRWSVTEESINRLVIVVVTGSAYAFAVVIVEVVDVIFLVEVVVVIEPVSAPVDWYCLYNKQTNIHICLAVVIRGQSLFI